MFSLVAADASEHLCASEVLKPLQLPGEQNYGCDDFQSIRIQNKETLTKEIKLCDVHNSRRWTAYPFTERTPESTMPSEDLAITANLDFASRRSARRAA
jgi:hypothetical protein